MAGGKVAPPAKYGGDITRFFNSGSNNAASIAAEREPQGIETSRSAGAPMVKKQQKPTAPTPAGGPSTSSDPVTKEVYEIIAANAVRAADTTAREAALEEALATARREAQEKVAAGGSLDPLLNEEQRLAVEAPIDRPLMIVAGAGTGKTRTIISRILHMVLLKEVHPASILLISFTTKSANEAKERIEKLGCPGTDRMHVSTFHSFCFRVLQRNFQKAGFDKCPTVLSENKDLQRIMSVVDVRCRVERYKEKLCTWLTLPMQTTSWQNVIDELQNEQPALYQTAAKNAAEWFIAKGVTKKKRKPKKKAAPVAKKPGGQKRKGAAAALNTQGSPSKQLRLNFGGGAPKVVVSVEENTAPAGSATAQEPEEENEEDYVALTSAGKLEKMPRELQTALIAHLYDALFFLHDANAYKSELEMVNKPKAKKNHASSLALSLLAPSPAKDIKKHLKDLEAQKTRGLSFDQHPEQRLFEAYQEELLAQNAVDFNDLLLKVRDIVKEHPHVAQSLQSKHPYIVIDEFQDTNAVQMEILFAIAPPASSPFLTVVGDGDQAIYGFRGTQPHIMYAAETFYEMTKLRLELNYRCSPEVLDAAAAALIGNKNRDPGERLLPTKPTHHKKAVVTKCHDASEEAKGIVKKIKAQIAQGTKPEEIAVLFRQFKTNSGRTYYSLQQELENHNIPYRIVREMSLLERAAVKDVLAYVDLVLNEENDAAFLRVMNTPRRGLGKAVEQQLLIMQDEHATDTAKRQRVSLFQCAKELLRSGELTGVKAKNLKGFVELVENLREDIMALRPAEVLDRIIEKSGYVKYLDEQAERAKKKKKSKGEEEEDDGQEEDGDDDNDGSSDEEDSDDDADDDDEEELEDAPVDANTSDEKQQKPTATQWPYNLKCDLKTAPVLRRLVGEGIRWVKEIHDPTLGSSSDGLGSVDEDGEDLGPASLEKLSLAMLSTSAGTFQMVKMLEEQRSSPDSESLRANFTGTALEVVLGASACGPAALREFCAHLRLNQSEIDASNKKKKKKKGDSNLSSAEVGVVISTIHAAKGLEWDVVFVPHFNHGFLPAHGASDGMIAEARDEVDAANRNNGDNQNGRNGNGIAAMADLIGAGRRSEKEEILDQVDEERRLAHVAITRSRENLFMSYLEVNSKYEDMDISPILKMIMANCKDAVDIEA
jgi:superfamily I DNA/RNA helicase